MPSDQILCPKCGSMQLHAGARGWRWMTGFIGSGKIRITCLKCGLCFRPGQGSDASEWATQAKNVQNLETVSGWPIEEKVVAIVGALMILGLVLISSRRQSTPADPATPAPLTDANARTTDEKLKDLRTAFARSVQDEFRRTGFDGLAYAVGDQLRITSDAFTLRAARDHFAAGALGPNRRRELCGIGFKSYSLRSESVSSQRSEYLIGCPETQQDREARLKGEAAKRREFISDVQKTLAKEGFDTTITEYRGELIMTSKAFANISPSMIQQELESMVIATKSLCSFGLRGARARATQSDPGVYLGFGCNTR